MKTIEDFLDESVKAKSEFSNDFKELMLKYKQGDCVRVFIESVIEHAMHEYAKQCCDEQKLQCAENAKIGLRCKLGSSPKTVVSKTSILNTPNVVTTNTK